MNTVPPGLSAIRLLRRTTGLLFVCVTLAGALAAKDVAPDWLQPYPRLQPSVATRNAEAVVLLDEGLLDVAKDGTFTTRTRFAVRLLKKDGFDYATARVSFSTSSEKVKSFRAWWIAPNGEVTALGRKDLVERATYSNALELYGESREQIMSARDRAEVGGLFAYESIVEEKGLFNQQRWIYRGTLPMEDSRFSVTLPPGWQVEAKLFNGELPARQQTGSTHTWAYGNSPALPDEAARPSRASLVPALVVDVVPPPATTAAQMRRAFGDWAGIVSYFSEHYDRAAAADSALAAKAASLTAGLDTPEARIRALCRFAQKINYISIDINSGRGGGMIPRPSAQVLRCNYGDCKDKSTLLCALLRSQGFEAYPVIVYSGDPTYVRPEWASPLQFNHCIIAVRVPDSVHNAAVLAHPQLGSLLYFDPTAEYTPFGYLPVSLYGSQGLILAGAKGGLLSLPALPAEPSRYVRHIEATVSPFGGISGRIVENFHGESAEESRDERGEDTESEFDQTITRWLSRSLAGVVVSKVTTHDEFEANRFNLTMDFQAASYSRLMRDVLLVFKPAFIARRRFPNLTAKKRELPVAITEDHFQETAVFALPAGFAVDETPGPVDLKTDFGRYRSSAQLKDGKVIYERELVLHRTLIPASDYQRVQEFFEAIQTAEQTPVVLAKQ